MEYGENNGTEEMGLVTPPPGAKMVQKGKFV